MFIYVPLVIQFGNLKDNINLVNLVNNSVFYYFIYIFVNKIKIEI